MTSRRFWLAHLGLPLALFMPLAIAFELTSLDFFLVDWLYDPVSRRWLGEGTWWAKDLIHGVGANLILSVFLAALVTYLGSFRWVDCLRNWRAPALLVALGILGCTTLVAVLKHYSNVDCPEDLLRYGGDRAYVSLFSAKPEGAARGACFPGGHSSGAFSLMVFYFLLRERGSRWAAPALCLAMLLGAVYAFGQWSRGEHLPSHDVWSAFVCWYVLLGLYAAGYKTSGWAYGVLSGPRMPMAHGRPADGY